MVSRVRGVVLDLRASRDLVDFLEHQDLMDPRSVDEIDTDFVDCSLVQRKLVDMNKAD